jgi:hypothetical protein
MRSRPEVLLLWAPRVLGILTCLFLSLFALDAFSPGKTVSQNIGDFALHVWPIVALLGVVALSWRWEWVGGLVFSVLAVAYAYWARPHTSWVAIISGPLLVVGVLFLLSWTRHRRARAMA